MHSFSSANARFQDYRSVGFKVRKAKEKVFSIDLPPATSDDDDDNNDDDDDDDEDHNRLSSRRKLDTAVIFQ